MPPGLGFYVSREIDPGNKDGKDGKDHEDRKRPINTMRIMSDEDDIRRPMTMRMTIRD